MECKHLSNLKSWFLSLGIFQKKNTNRFESLNSLEMEKALLRVELKVGMLITKVVWDGIEPTEPVPLELPTVPVV